MRSPAPYILALCFSTATLLSAQNPGAREDAEDAREKLLKAADQIDNIQANSEATKTSVDGVKGDITSLQQTVTKLQQENTDLKKQLADLQTSLDNYKDEQLKSRQKLIDDVAGLIAADKGGSSKSTKKKKDADSDEPAFAAKKPEAASNLTPPADNPPVATSSTPTTATSTTPAPADDTPPPKPQKGYYHTVAFGETLSMICNAYRDNGVNVSVADVRKANGLTEHSQLKAGQKLFIPKPGT